MRRRAFLATVSGMAGVVAGCTSGRETETVTPAPVPTTDVQETERRRFRGQPCPTFDADTDQTVCPQTDPTATVLTFQPDRPVVRVSGGTPVRPLRVTLGWRARRPLEVLVDDWYHVRRSGDSWTRVASGDGDREAVTLRQGEQQHWIVGTAVTNRDDVAVVPTTLAPGRHALAVQTVSGDMPLHTECVALFDAIPE